MRSGAERCGAERRPQVWDQGWLAPSWHCIREARVWPQQPSGDGRGSELPMTTQVHDFPPSPTPSPSLPRGYPTGFRPTAAH